MLELNIHIDGIDDVIAALSPRQLNTIATRTLNRSARVAKTEGSRAIRETYNIKAKDINKAVSITAAHTGDNKVTLLVKGDRLPFKYFGARQTKRGVTFMIKKSKGRGRLRHAFIGGWIPVRTRKRGYRMVYVGELLGGHVYMRAGKKRLPIKKLMTHLSIPGLFQRYFPRISKKVTEFWETEFPRLMKLAWEKKIRF